MGDKNRRERGPKRRQLHGCKYINRHGGAIYARPSWISAITTHQSHKPEEARYCPQTSTNSRAEASFLGSYRSLGSFGFFELRGFLEFFAKNTSNLYCQCHDFAVCQLVSRFGIIVDAQLWNSHSDFCGCLTIHEGHVVGRNPPRPRSRNDDILGFEMMCHGRPLLENRF